MLARAMVNRVWAMLFGRGLVHPVDLMDSKHPASHPELLDWLARDFERSGCDVKRLIRTLCNTKAYQLDSMPARRGKARSPGPETFARALDKPLTAEQLFRSLLVATANQPDKDGKSRDFPSATCVTHLSLNSPTCFRPNTMPRFPRQCSFPTRSYLINC